jgi:hypothetical protein
MSLNALYFSHQIALMRASAAGDVAGRDRHHADADCYADQIGAIQQHGGAAAAPLIRAASL